MIHLFFKNLTWEIPRRTKIGGFPVLDEQRRRDFEPTLGTVALRSASASMHTLVGQERKTIVESVELSKTIKLISISTCKKYSNILMAMASH
jgi:hypothetical protein